MGSYIYIVLGQDPIFGLDNLRIPIYDIYQRRRSEPKKKKKNLKQITRVLFEKSNPYHIIENSLFHSSQKRRLYSKNVISIGKAAAKGEEKMQKISLIPYIPCFRIRIRVLSIPRVTAKKSRIRLNYSLFEYDERPSLIYYIDDVRLHVDF